MLGSLGFRRKPYTVVYKDFHSGELRQIRRRPPEKQHDILPTDIVELKTQRGDDWQEGDSVSVKHVSYRAPNLLQLKNSEGDTTFTPYFDVELEEEVAYRPGKEKDVERSNRYLRWP
ncbi:MAG: hypothetical protein H6618_02415 [Deltaproteobacteria bacterium]|nr:hypothetical protein [Deltaproteobacteria bacterium]